MKIAVVNWQDPDHPFAGGAEFHLHEYLRRLAHRHEIHWFGARARGMPAVEVKEDGITYHRKGPWHLANFVAPGLYRAWRRHHRPDVVVDSITKVPFFLPLMERDVPVVAFVPHLFGTTVYQETNLILGTYVVLMEQPIPWVYRRCPFLVSSWSTREDLVRRGIRSDRIHIFPPGVDAQRFVPGARAPSPLVVHLGRIKRYKRVDLVLKAFARVVRTIPDARLAIVGGGDDLPRLIRLAGKWGLDKVVEFTGRVSEEEKIRYLQRAWVFVNTSPKEGWGMVNTEAQACGTPVVAFDAPGIRDSVRHGETGFLVPYGDVEALSARIVEILRNPELRETLGHRARSFAQRLSWDHFARDLEKFLHSVVAGVDPIVAQEKNHET